MKRIIQFGQATYEYPSDSLQPLRDSSDVVTKRADLLARLEEDGYLYLPGFLDRNDVLQARRTILRHMAEHEAMEPGSRPLDGVMGQYGKHVGLMGKPAITHHPDVLKVLAADRLFELNALIHGEITQKFGGVWQTSDIQAGDIITFGMHLMHASTTNITDKWRLSCDVRFQPASDPMDPRWSGKEPTGHKQPPDAPKKTKSMEEARTEWGI